MALDYQAVQDALGAYLAGHADIITAFGADDVVVTAAPEEDQAFPFIMFGGTQVYEESTGPGCSDAARMVEEVVVVTNERGYTRCKQIALAVRKAVNETEWVIAGHNLVSSKHQKTQFFPDAENTVREGVVSVEILVDAT